MGAASTRPAGVTQKEWREQGAGRLELEWRGAAQRSELLAEGEDFGGLSTRGDARGVVVAALRKHVSADAGSTRTCRACLHLDAG